MTNEQTTVIHLIRHGETTWNDQKLWQGHADSPLSDKGYWQSELLGRRMRDEQWNLTKIYSSDLIRASETAKQITKFLPIEINHLECFREIDLGSWSGLTAEQIKARFPQAYSKMEQGYDVRRGGGETVKELESRVRDCLDLSISRSRGETYAIVTHGGPIKAILAYAEGKSLTLGEPFSAIANTSISTIELSRHGWRVIRFNDCSHLTFSQVD